MFKTERYEKKHREIRELCRSGQDYKPEPPTKCFNAEYPDPLGAGTLDEYVLRHVRYDLEAPMPTIHKQFIIAIMKYKQSRDSVVGSVSFEALGYMNLYFEDDALFYDYCASYQLSNHS